MWSVNAQKQKERGWILDAGLQGWTPLGPSPLVEHWPPPETRGRAEDLDWGDIANSDLTGWGGF